MNNLKERNIILVILFTIITFGIYGIYMYFVFNSEVQRQAEVENVQTKPRGPVMALLFAIITFGIYGVMYQYFIAKALKEIGDKHNYNTVDPILVVILTLFVGVGPYINIYSGSQLAKKIEVNV